MSEQQHFKIHQCTEHNHYHFLSGDEEISWSFCSYQCGIKMLDFVLEQHASKPEDTVWFRNEIACMKTKLKMLSQVQRRDCRGRFGEPIMARQWTAQDSYGYNAQLWSDFREGKSKNAIYVVSSIIVTAVFPLYCDFVERKTSKPQGARNLSQWSALAEEPCRIITMRELGITLDPIESG